MNKLDLQYQALLQDILQNGAEKKDRTGTGTISVFGRAITHNMQEGFPLLTTKKMAWKGVVSELLWFLRGETNIKSLVEQKNYIWVGDAYKKYCNLTSANSSEWNEWMRDNGDGTLSMYTRKEFIEKIRTDDKFAEKWGDLGPIYGKQWRNWGSERVKSVHDVTTFMRENGEVVKEDKIMAVLEKPIDQIQQLIDDLKKNPDSRRLMVNAWNVAEIEEMTLPPCHYGFQVYTRELKIEERMNLIRSNEYDKIIVAYCENPSDTWLEGQIDQILADNNVPTRAISLMWNQRSVDTFLGLPFNIASYGLLLSIIAEIVNMVPEELIGVLGDTHLYSNHVEQAKLQIGHEYTDEELFQMKPELKTVKEAKHNYVIHQLYEEAAKMRETEKKILESLPRHTREPFSLPKLSINTEFWCPGTSEGCGMGPGTYAEDFDALVKGMQVEDFQILDYQSHPAIEAPLSN